MKQPTAFNQLHAVPWKNGGGVTRELACFPPGASFDEFTWRVSIADVHASGPFSAFLGIDRVIALLDGDGMHLQFADGKMHALNEPLAPFSFAGERQLHAELVGTPSRDFNLMLRRDRARGGIDVLRASGVMASGPDSTLLYCASGRWQVGDDCLLGSGDHVLLQRDAGKMDEAPIKMLQAGGALVCVNINLIDRT